MKMSMISEPPAAAIVAVEFAALVTMIYWRQDFFEWSGSDWSQIDAGRVAFRVRLHVVEVYGEEYAEADFVLAVVATLKQILYRDSRIDAPFKLNGESVGDCLIVENGVLDLQPLHSGGEPRLLPHDSNLFALGRTAYPFDPTAKAPLFGEYLDWLVKKCEKTKQLLLEMMAYILLLGLSYQKLFWLVGPGSNGKSVFLHTVRNLVGNASVSAIPLERLGSRFQNAALLHSRVNIASDVSELSRLHGGVVKQICDGSPVPLERKYRDTQFMVVKTRFLFASNALPPIPDRSDGFWRRLVLILCDSRVEREIPQYELQLCKELPGILNLAIEAAKTLAARGCFDLPESCLQAIAEERLMQDTAALFCSQCVVITGNKNDFLPGSELYSRYDVWCRANGHRALSSAKFGRALTVIYRDEIESHRLYRTKRQVAESFGNRVEHRNVHAWAGLLVASFDGEVLVETAPTPSPSPIAGTIAPTPPAAARKLTAIEREARQYGVSPRDIAKQRQLDRIERKRRKPVGDAMPTVAASHDNTVPADDRDPEVDRLLMEIGYGHEV